MTPISTARTKSTEVCALHASCSWISRRSASLSLVKCSIPSRPNTCLTCTRGARLALAQPSHSCTVSLCLACRCRLASRTRPMAVLVWLSMQSVHQASLMHSWVSRTRAWQPSSRRPVTRTCISFTAAASAAQTMMQRVWRPVRRSCSKLYLTSIPAS